jgi:hypothetical protein
MKTYIVSCLVAIVIAVIGYFALAGMQETVDTAFATTSVRI